MKILLHYYCNMAHHLKARTFYLIFLDVLNIVCCENFTAFQRILYLCEKVTLYIMLQRGTRTLGEGNARHGNRTHRFCIKRTKRDCGLLKNADFHP